jgi:hypothetical protein
MPLKPKKIPDAVKSTIRRVAKGEDVGPQLGDLAAHFFDRAGGPKAVASLLYEEFREARKGSLIRQRILDMILRCVRFEEERTPPRPGLGTLEDAELDRQLERLLGDLEEEKPNGGSQGPAADPGLESPA